LSSPRGTDASRAAVLQSVTAAPTDLEPTASPENARLWRPRRVVVTASAARFEHGRAIAARAEAQGLEVLRLGGDRLPKAPDLPPGQAYALAKATLAVVVSPPGERKLQPISPSADWQFHLARGCPAHCQYCYLAGSLPGPPITRAYVNIDEILAGLPAYLGLGTVTSASAERVDEGTTYEASCYTDPLGIEHLTGSLARAIEYFGAWEADVALRFTTKFDAVGPLLGLAHRGRTRVRFSVNAEPITRRFEGGTAPLRERIAALRACAAAGYPVGLTLAPIMPIPEWREHYAALLGLVREALADVPGVDLTVECITHRFTEKSKAILGAWYPHTTLEMDEAARTLKFTKFGSKKYVYSREIMAELRTFVTTRVAADLPAARLLYWT